MRLATYELDGATAVGVERDDGSAALVPDGYGSRYRDVAALFAAGPPGREDAERAREEAEPVGPERLKLRRPVLEPGAVVCVGLNYRSHILEMRRRHLEDRRAAARRRDRDRHPRRGR